MDDEILRAGQVAELMGISESYFFALKKRGLVPPALNLFKRARYSKKVVVAWIEKKAEERNRAIEKEVKEKIGMIKNETF